jgi:hypothetical protein
MAIEVLIIAALIVTLILSKENNGFATIPGTVPLGVNNSFVQVSIKTPSTAYGLLWTTLPAFIMSCYGALWQMLVEVSGVRYPFVALLKDGGRSARKTILLDYRFDGGFWGLCKMRRNKHWAFLLATLLQLALTLVITPLSSHVYESKSTTSTSSVPVDFPTTYNADAVDSLSNLIGPLAIASAITTYGSTPPPWMDLLYAYPPFTANFPANGTVSVQTTAYSASLDCRVLGPSDYSSKAQNNNVTSITLSDRGCTATPLIQPSEDAIIYSTVWTEQSCSANAGSARLGLLAASVGQQLSELSVISCVPYYWTSNGTLEVSLRTNSTPLVSSYENKTPWTSSRPAYADAFENELSLYAVVDPTKELSTNQFGTLIYQYSLAKNPNNPLDSTTLMNGTQNLFASIHAALAVNKLFVPGASIKGTGNLSQSVMKLYTIPTTCIILIAAIVLHTISNIWLFAKARQNASILTEEPTGLLSAAAMTYDSRNIGALAPRGDGVQDFIEQFRAQYGGIEEIHEKALKDYEVNDSKCYYDRNLGVIRVNLNRRNIPQPGVHP